MSLPVRATRFSLALILLSCLAPVLHAQIRVTPTRLELKARPGDPPTVHQFRIENKTAQTQTTLIEKRDFRVDLDGNIVHRHRAETDAERAEVDQYAASSFVGIEVDAVELGPHEAKTVSVTIGLPATVSDARFTMLVFTPSAVERAPASVIDVTLRVGVIVLINPKSDIETSSVSLSDVRLVPPENARDGARVVAIAQNDGNVLCEAHSTGTLVNLDTREPVERLRFSRGFRYILPGAKRRFIAPITADLTPGRYQARFDFYGGKPDSRRSKTRAFDIEEAIAGSGKPPFPWPPFAPEDAGFEFTLKPGEVASDEMTLFNGLFDPLRVRFRWTQGESDAVTFALADSEATIPAAGVLPLRVSATALEGAAAGVYAREIELTPLQSDGSPSTDEPMRLDDGGKTWERWINAPELWKTPLPWRVRVTVTVPKAP